MFAASKKMTAIILIITPVMSLSACPSWSKRNRNTTVGTGAGALGDAVLTDGSAPSILGSTAVGSVIDHQVGK